MKNPYTHRSTIRDPSMFFGRTDDLTRIYALLANTQNISITGDRRIGKSSLLYCLALPEVQARVSSYDFSNYLFLYEDLQGHLYKNATEFLNYLLSRLQRQLRDRDAFHFAPEGGHDAFEDVMALANKHGLKMVFLFDEFDYITQNEHLDASFFSFMRYMANNYDLALITVSRQRLASLCHQGIVDSPFFNIFASLRLDDLAEQEAWALINEPSFKAGCPLANDVDWIIERVGQHPLFIQIVCFHLLQAKYGQHQPGALLQKETMIDYDQVEQFYYQEAQDHFEYAWQHLTPEELQLVNREIWQNAGPYHHYLTKGQVFRRFARRGTAGAKVRVDLISEEIVKEVLKNLANTAYLGRSALVRLNILRYYLERRDTALGPDYGKALQKLFSEIIRERLRPADNISKLSPKWRYWSILELRYLDNIANVDIIRRLNIAERTFYREHNKAIEEVVTILQGMEAGSNLPELT